MTDSKQSTEYSPVAQDGQELEMQSPSKTEAGGDKPANYGTSGGGGVGALSGGNEDKICLKPKMSLLNGITVIVGSIIGSGIFVSPKGVLENTGSVGLSLTVWIISGVFSLIGAVSTSNVDYLYFL